MATHEIAPGAFVSDVVFKSVFGPGAAVPRLESITDPDPFNWVVVSGKPNQTSGLLAMQTTVSFVPKGVPSGFLFGVKQVAFHRGESSFYDGDGPQDGSQVHGSTDVNFVWLLDLQALLSASGFSAPSVPFFSSKPISVPNNSVGTIDVKDSPGGIQHLVRSNLVTVKRNFLLKHGGSTDFVTFLVVEKPDATHLPLEGFAWTVRSDAEISWSGGKPSLTSSGDASFQKKLDRSSIAGDRLSILSANALGPEDCISFKFNNGKILAEARDAATPPRGPSGPKDDIVIAERAYSITHSAKPSDFRKGRDRLP